MQPKSDVAFDKPSFQRLRDRLRSRAQVTRQIEADPHFGTALPEETGLQLTKSGLHRLFPAARQRDDLDIRIIERLLAEKDAVRGKGTHDRIMEPIDLLLDLKARKCVQLYLHGS